MVPCRVGNYQFIIQTCSTDFLALLVNISTVDGMLYKYTHIVLFQCSSQPQFPILKKYFNITSCLFAEKVKYCI